MSGAESELLEKRSRVRLGRQRHGSSFCVQVNPKLSDFTESTGSTSREGDRFHGTDNIMDVAPDLKHVVLHHHQDLYSSGMDDMYGSVHVTYPWLKTVEQLEIADSSGDATIGISESFAVSDRKPTLLPIYFAAPPTRH